VIRVQRRALRGCRWRDRAALAGAGDAAVAATVPLSLSPVLGVRAASRLLRRTAVAVLLDRVVVPRDMFVLVFFSFLLLFDQHARSWLGAGRRVCSALGEEEKETDPTSSSKHHKVPPFSLPQCEISAPDEKSTGRANHHSLLKYATIFANQNSYIPRIGMLTCLD